MRLRWPWIKKSNFPMRYAYAKAVKVRAKWPAQIREAAEHCSHHRDEILSSTMCGCFYCLQTFKPSEIKEWLVNGTCAVCPSCEIDAVLGDKSGYPITHEFLSEMHSYWFGKKYSTKLKNNSRNI
jgi:hypothetical protein